MNDLKWDLEKKQGELNKLLKIRSDANCDTRNRTAADVQREQEIEELENDIETLEKKIREG
jgi:hypothetical protein